MKVISYAVLSCALLSGCTSAIRRDGRVEFALSSPGHLSDWQQVQNGLRAEGIECTETGSSLGTSSCSIPPASFGQAKEIVVALVGSNSLTVRVKKRNDAEIFEVYERGKKVKEESYAVK